jgi:hypothetical protein
MQKMNCWEFHKCGRELKSGQHDAAACPVSTETRLNAVHDGNQAGRACWVIAGTHCRGEVQGNFAKKYSNCEKCDFYRQVRQEEGAKFQLSIVLLNKLKN